LALRATCTVREPSRLPNGLGGGSRTSKHRYGPADISAVLPNAGWRSSPVRPHPREVCPLARGMMLPTGSIPSRPITGRPSLAPSSFTRCPVRASYAFPSGGVRHRRATGLPRSAGATCGGLGRASTPVVQRLRVPSSERHILTTYLFGPSLSASLAWPLGRRLRRFTWVDHATRSWSPTASMLAVAVSAHALTTTPQGEDTLPRELRTAPLPAPHVPVGYNWQNSR